MSTRCPVHWEGGRSDYCTILGEGVPLGEGQTPGGLGLAHGGSGNRSVCL